MKRIIIGALAIIALGAGSSAYYAKRTTIVPQVSTAIITRGDIVEAVASTGTVDAVTTVQVGSQVSGTVAWLGADFNSEVRKGQVIAKLDPSLLEAQVRQSRASLAKAQADEERAGVQLTDTKQKYGRALQLAEKQIVARSDLDAAKLAVDSAEADLKAARAQLAQAEATLYQNEVNVGHAIITAPIDGTVIARNVDVGQTVAASLQSPTLFEIAADLTRMRVKASIDEADMGRVRAGQAATFTVDAYPTEVFRGAVIQVRLQPTVTQNVTTYSSIVNVANPDLRLKPGMTANIRIQVASRSGVLRVPNAAFRFKPTTEILTALAQPDAVRPATSTRAAASPGGSRVWVYANGLLTAVAVRTGISDGTNTELVDTSLGEGARVITAVTLDGSSSSGTTRKGTTSPLTGGRSPMGGGPPGPPPM